MSRDFAETVTPEGHVDDVGCWCGPAVHPVAGLMHTLTSEPGWTTTTLGILTAARPIGRRIRLVVDHPGQLEGRPARGQVIDGRLRALERSELSSVYVQVHVQREDGDALVVDLPLDHAVELGPVDVDPEVGRRLWEALGRPDNAHPTPEQLLLFVRLAPDEIAQQLAEQLLKASDEAADCHLRHRLLSRPAWTSEGAQLIAHERSRQITDEGRTPDHDAQHTAEQLAWAAACYAAPEPVYRVEVTAGRVAWREPWPVEWVPNVSRGDGGYVPWRRPKADRVRQLVKAGALIAAEIDRLQAQDGTR